MAAEAGSIEVSLRARIDQLEGDLRKARKATEDTANGMRGRFKSIGAAVKKVKGNVAAMAGVLVGLAGAKMVQVAKSAINVADAIGNTADKLGISTEALQEFQFAATQTGVSAETLSMGLQRFGRRAAEAANGTGESRDALRQLGVQLRNEDGTLRSTEALFTSAMESLAAVEDPLERVRLGFKLFDSEGVALVNMADNFGELREKAEAMGIVLEDRVIRNAQENKAEFDALWEVTKNQLAPAFVHLGENALTPTVQLFADLTTWASKVYHSFLDLKDQRLSDLMLRKAEELSEIERLQKLIREHEAETEPGRDRNQGRAGKAYQDRQRRLAAARERLRLAEEEIKLRRKAREEEEEERRSGAGLTPVKTQAELDREEKDRLRAIEKRRQLEKDAHKDWLAAHGERAELIRLEYEEKIAALTENLEAEEDYTAAVTQLREAMHADLAALAKEEAEDLKKQVDEQEKAWQGLYDFMEDGFSDALATMLLDGELTFKALGQAFLREMVQVGISKMVAGLFGQVGKFFAGPPGNVSMNLTGGIPASRMAANGGAIRGATLVGERGPELFIPGTSGFIATNFALQKMASAGGSGGPVSVTVINNTGQESTTQEKDGPGGQRTIEVMVGKAISKNIARGGDVDAAIRNSYGLNRVGRHGI